MTDVFISYARSDFFNETTKEEIPGNVIRKVKDAFEAAKISCWIDTEKIAVGERWATIIPPAIQECKVFVFVSSKHSNESDFTKNEVAIAHEYEKHIIPFRIDATKYNTGIVVHTAGLEHIAYYAEPDKGIDRLVKAVQKYLDEINNKKLKEQEERERQKRIQEIDKELRLQYEQKLNVENTIDEKQKDLLEVEAQRDNILSTIESLEKNKKALNGNNASTSVSDFLGVTTGKEETTIKSLVSNLLARKGTARMKLLFVLLAVILIIMLPYLGWLNCYKESEELMEEHKDRFLQIKNLAKKVSGPCVDVYSWQDNHSSYYSWYTSSWSEKKHINYSQGDTLVMESTLSVATANSNTNYYYEGFMTLNVDGFEFDSRRTQMKGRLTHAFEKSGSCNLRWHYEHYDNYDVAGKYIKIYIKSPSPISTKIINLCNKQVKK